LFLNDIIGVGVKDYFPQHLGVVGQVVGANRQLGGEVFQHLFRPRQHVPLGPFNNKETKKHAPFILAKYDLIPASPGYYHRFTLCNPEAGSELTPSTYTVNALIDLTS
jgi:hypothetical protein